MRNYIKELRTSGLSLQQISKETGIGVKKLSNLSRDTRTLKSASKDYQIIRNANRRIAYRKLSESGFSSESATKYRRIGLSSETYQHQSMREVKHTHLNRKMYQLKVLAEYENLKTKERRIIEGFSWAHLRISSYSTSIEKYFNEIEKNPDSEFDYSPIVEAIRDGQSKLGSSNWILIRIIDVEKITYNIA